MSRRSRNSSPSFATFFESFPKKSLFDLVISAERCTFAAAFRGVAQLVALLVWDQAVARSSRVAPTARKEVVIQRLPFVVFQPLSFALSIAI